MSDPENPDVTKPSFVTREMPPQTNRVRLVTLTGPDAGRVYRFRESVVVGRDYDCEVRLEAVDVSRTHAHISRLASGDWTIEDMGSRNGTWVNGLPTDELQTLEFGDRVQIGGHTIFIFTHYDHLEEQMLQMQKMESIGQLAGEVAHDFKNLLSVVNSNVDFLTAQSNDGKLEQEELLECLGEMKEVTREAVALTSRLLGFSRQGKGEEAPVDLSTLSAEVVKLCHRTFDSAVTVEESILPDLWANGDRHQLHQALMNLCLNARDAMPDGGVLKVTLQKQQIDGLGLLTVPLLAAGNYVVVEIKDSGVGMDEETRERAFEPFFTTKGEDGTGLGLATVFGVIKSHGGHVELDSSAGKGTVFRIYLPSLDDADDHGDTFHNVPTPVMEADLEANTILLVDDDEAVRLVTARMLKLYGYEVLVARDGMEAVSFFEEHRNSIVLVVMDMMMPELNGLDAYNVLKKMKPNVRVLIVSGFFTPENKQALMDAGVRGLLPKPYDAETLHSSINKILIK